MNMQPVHMVMLCLSAAAMGLPNLEAAFPPAWAPAMRAAAAMCVFVSGVLGQLSPSAAGAKELHK